MFEKDHHIHDTHLVRCSESAVLVAYLHGMCVHVKLQ